MSEYYSVAEARALFLEDLGEQVTGAFDNPDLVTVEEGEKGKVIKERAEELEFFGYILNLLPDDFELNCIKDDFMSSVVYVENPHDYMDLLKIVEDEMGRRVGGRQDYDEVMERDWSHELMHHVPALGQ
jgi:hypothetical protein